MAIAAAAMEAQVMRLGAGAKTLDRAPAMTARLWRPCDEFCLEHSQGANRAVLHATRATLARVIAMLA